MSLLSILVLSEGLWAQNFKITVDQKKSQLAVLGVLTTFQTEEGSLSGNGISLDFSHAFNSKLTVDLTVSTALSFGGAVTNSFTGLNGYIYYNFLAPCCEESKVWTLNGAPLLTEKMSEPFLLQLGAGLNQYFLNGNRGVYSASGLGIGAQFHFRLWSYQVKVMAKSGQLSSNENQVTSLVLGAGLVFPL